MNKELIIKYFLYEVQNGKYPDSFEINEIIEYYGIKTQFVYNKYDYSHPNNGYLISYTQRGSMGFTGKYFILASDIRENQLKKVLYGVNNNEDSPSI